MRVRVCLTIVICLLGVSLFALPCMATAYKVIIADYQFFVEKPGNEKLVLRVRGKVKNVSSKPVRDVVVTTECAGCTRHAANEKWTDASGKDVVIKHMGPGEIRAFELTAATMTSPYWASKKGTGTGLTKDFPNSPPGLMVKVLSFKPAE